jgi:hypothetical protein
VLVDVVASASKPTDGQLAMRRDLYDLVHGALVRRGLGLHSLGVHDTGDGLRLCVPCHRLQPTEIIDLFVLGLLAGLRQHRRLAAESARIR